MCIAGFDSLFWLILVSLRQSQTKRPLSFGSPREIRKSLRGEKSTASIPYLCPYKCLISVYEIAFLTRVTSVGDVWSFDIMLEVFVTPPSNAAAAPFGVDGFDYLTWSTSSYSISQIVIYGNLNALSPAAKNLPSDENLAHWKGREVRDARNLTCLASRGE